MMTLLASVLGTAVAFAQTAPSFEVAAIRENTAGGITAELALVVNGPAGRPVFDETGLMGFYVVQLRYSGRDAASGDAVAIFTAVQEQLGLRLNSTAPLDVVVVDSISRPTPH